MQFCFLNTSFASRLIFRTATFAASAFFFTSFTSSFLANISVPEARVIQIQPWDSSLIKEIEKMIIASDLGLTPNNDGKTIKMFHSLYLKYYFLLLIQIQALVFYFPYT